MAHVKLLADSNQFVRVAYFVDAAVGHGCQNRKDDVYLVQFFLNALWGFKVRTDMFGATNQAAPAVDGICGTETIEAIRRFEQFYWPPFRQSPLDFIDGRVDAVPPGQKFGPIHGNPYVMIGLNVNFGARFGIDRHALIWKEPKFPTALKEKLFV